MDIGRNRGCGHASDVNHPNIAGAQASAYTSLFKALQQVLVELAIGLGVALEHGVFDRALVQLVLFLFLQDYFVRGVTMTGLREG